MKQTLKKLEDSQKLELPKADLTIIVLSFNTQFWLKKTLNSLKKFYIDKSKYKIHVIVVDNDSEDGSPEMIKKDFKWASLIRSGGNLGFSAGNNMALRQVKSKYVALLNSDTEFTDASNFDVILDYMNKNKKVAVTTPRLELPNGELDKACHRGEPTLTTSFYYFIKLEKLFPQNNTFGQYHLTFKDLSEIHTIDACSGAIMIIRTEAMKKVGYLDERYFMYAEDIDWCHEFRDAGYEIVFHPGAKIIHHKYKSGIKSSSSKLRKKVHNLFYDTMLIYYDKWYADKYPRFVRFFLKSFLFMKKGGL